MFLLQKRLKHIKLRLKEWNKKEYGNIFEEKKSVEGKIQELNQTLIMEGFDKDRSDQANKYHQEWENLCKQEEIFWRKKSRVQWLKEGERNTKFFHRSTMVNRAHNRIYSIKDEGDREQSIRVISKHIPKLVTREENFNLIRPVSKEEVSEVLKEMQTGKVLGSDGFNVDFFKACWNIVKHDVLNVVEDSRRNKTILKELNTTFISLIPKQELDQTPDRFRTISLCNVIYKIISKVVANRLKLVLPTLVSLNNLDMWKVGKSSATSFKLMRWVHSLKNNRNDGMIMQLDIAKAYDKLNWTYIRKFLISFGFDHN
eukprot:PITA_08591